MANDNWPEEFRINAAAQHVAGPPFALEQRLKPEFRARIFAVRCRLVVEINNMRREVHEGARDGSTVWAEEHNG